MKTEQRVITNSYVQLKTDLPLFTETYHFPANYEDGLHSHEFFEIGLCLEGEGIHQVGSEEQLLHRGDVYLIPIGKDHSVRVPTSLQVQNIYFLPRLVYQNLNTTSLPNPLFNHFLLSLLQKQFKSIHHLKLSEEAVRSMAHLILSHQKISLSGKQLLDNFRSNCLLNMLMILCEAYYEQFPSDLSMTDVRIPKILNIIQEHIERPTVELIELMGDQLHLHPQYINKIIKNTFSTTLSNLIIETKIEKSCSYLLGDYSVTEAAHALAFYDHSHFNKYFVKYFGISPTQYKDKYGAPGINESSS